MSEERLQHYQTAERRLWEHFGAEPQDHFLELQRPRAKVRIQEVGKGEPVLFVHGGPSAGSEWASLATRLQDFRCLILDRPGTGLSGPVDYSATDLRSLAVDVLRSVLDALGLERSHLVGNSLGGSWALWFAQACPDRVARMAQIGCPAFIEGMKLLAFMRLLSIPGLNRVMTKLQPMTVKFARNMFRQIGHGASIDAGRIPDVLFEWYYHLMKHTATMRRELTAIEKACVWPWRDMRHDLILGEQDFRKTPQPTLFLWGEDDPFGGPQLGHRAAGVLENATVHAFAKSGHLPWLDDPETIAHYTRDFLLS
ncbi:MAG: alpha/beta fold hydrolase [Dehalococcoidia bacterium]